MRRFRGIVQSSIEPKDKEMIWLNRGSLYYFDIGRWQTFDGNSDDILYLANSEDSEASEYITVSKALDLLFQLGLANKSKSELNEEKLSILNADSSVEGSVDYKIANVELRDVDIFVDNSIGNPSAEGEIKNNTLYISISGVKGEQGNSGYSGAADELEVVNNLTDGGATKALSAEMGKRLYESSVYLTEEEYNQLVKEGKVKDYVEYNIYEES